MQPHPSLRKLVIFLREKGYSDDEIADIAEELAKKSSLMLYTNAMAAFTEEDVAAVEKCETDEKANEKIIELYALRTGRNPMEELNLFLTKFAEEFTKAIEKEPVRKKS